MSCQSTSVKTKRHHLCHTAVPVQLKSTIAVCKTTQNEFVSNKNSAYTTDFIEIKNHSISDLIPKSKHQQKEIPKHHNINKTKVANKKIQKHQNMHKTKY